MALWKEIGMTPLPSRGLGCDLQEGASVCATAAAAPYVQSVRNGVFTQQDFSAVYPRA